VAALQDSSAKQLSAHIKTADRIIRELEATATSLQVGLGCSDWAGWLCLGWLVVSGLIGFVQVS